jgi:hypothetical protein
MRRRTRRKTTRGKRRKRRKRRRRRRSTTLSTPQNSRHKRHTCSKGMQEKGPDRKARRKAPVPCHPLKLVRQPSNKPSMVPVSCQPLCMPKTVS